MTVSVTTQSLQGTNRQSIAGITGARPEDAKSRFQWYFSAVRCLLISLFIPLLIYTGALNALECSDYYGLNICADSLDLTDEQASYLEPSENRYSVTAEETHSPLKTGLAAEDMNQLQEESVFRNIDDFRAYMSTLEPAEGTSDDDFSFRTRILDSTNFDLDCRLVTDNLYNISKSNRYDCALQREF